MKTFRHHKLGRIAEYKGNGSYSCKEIGCGDDYKKENDLIALGFEEVKDNHFGNGMIEEGKHYFINTTRVFDSDYRTGSSGFSNDWSCFQTKEQAHQFDKMMMTVWKIWKWKKENDDKMDYSNYYLTLDKDNNKFFAWEQCFIGDFFLPPFSSEEKVNQLISDLGEELNNLLYWIK